MTTEQIDAAKRIVARSLGTDSYTFEQALTKPQVHEAYALLARYYA